MDIFMDKLAQRATAQEIIKANTAADVEELNRLKNQIVEYNECLERLQGLVNEASSRLAAADSRDSEGRTLAREGLEGVKALRRTIEGLGQSQRKMAEQLENMDKSVAARLEGMDKSVAAHLEGADKSVAARLENMDKSVAARFGGMDKSVPAHVESMDKSMAAHMEDAARSLAEKMEGLNDLTEQRLTEKLNAVEDNVHKECVKVYRNVQAVVTEESGKQCEALAESRTGVSSVKGRLGLVLGISVTAMIMSLASLVFQILAHLGVLPF